MSERARWRKVWRDLWATPSLMHLGHAPLYVLVVAVVHASWDQDSDEGVLVSGDGSPLARPVLARLARMSTASVNKALRELEETGTIELREKLVVLPNFGRWQESPRAAAARKLGQAETDDKTVKQWVYLIGGPTGAVKIGTSKNPWARLATLRKESGRPDLEILGKVKGGHALEADLHRRFAAMRVEGEWFSRSSEIFDYFTSSHTHVVADGSSTVVELQRASASASASPSASASQAQTRAHATEPSTDSPRGSDPRSDLRNRAAQIAGPLGEKARLVDWRTYGQPGGLGPWPKPQPPHGPRLAPLALTKVDVVLAAGRTAQDVHELVHKLGAMVEAGAFEADKHRANYVFDQAWFEAVEQRVAAWSERTTAPPDEHAPIVSDEMLAAFGGGS